jgi:hypothetical protein
VHPTSIDAPLCSPAGPVLLGTTLTCTTTVRDTYNPASDRKAPWGWVDWQIDGTTISYCHLSQLPTGDTNNTCSLTYLVPATLPVGPHTLTVRYGYATPTPPPPGPLESNHNRTTAQLTINVQPNLHFTVACVNDVLSPNPNAPVWVPQEIGHPIRCNVIVQDGSSGTLVNVPNGMPIQWSTTNGGGTTGVGMFTCAIPAAPFPVPSGTGYNSGSHTAVPDVYSDSTNCPRPVINPSQPVSFTCFISGGNCSVLYRRLYDSSYGGVGPTPPLVITALDPSTYQPITSYTYPLPNITSPSGGTFHQAQGYTYCNPGSFNQSNQNSMFSNATIQSTQSIDVHGGTVGGTGSVTLTCTAYVFDVRPSPVLNYGWLLAPGSTSNPNFADGNPPMGVAHFRQNGNPMANCPLGRVDFAALTSDPNGTIFPPGQATGQAPFMSSCTLANFPISGTITDMANLGTAPVTVGFSYDGEPVSSPGHGALDCTSAPLACFKVNFVSP